MRARQPQHKTQADFGEKVRDGGAPMRNPTEYVKMRVLAAIDMAEGKTITERIRAVSALTFEDEEGRRRRFTF